MNSSLWTRLKEMIIRHRFTLTDMAMIAAVLIVATFAIWQYDIFPNESGGERKLTFELDEVFAVCALGFALFAWSRLRAQRREIGRRRAAEEEARILAFEDTLTGLPNRRQFDAALKAALAALPGADAVHAVFMLDLNGFKRINDVYGHPVGDEVLVKTAIRLRKAIREPDMIARLGGDEFAVLARHLAGAEEAATLALRMIEALKDPLQTGSGEHVIGAGIGIALAPADGVEAETLLRKADVALYRAKAVKPSALRFFEEEMDRHIRERDILERDLRAAIGVKELEVIYLPRIDLKSGVITSFEAGPRWAHSQCGELDPVRLFAIAEAAGVVQPLVDDLLRVACTDAAGWGENVTLSFGIPPALLKDDTLGLRIMAILGESGLPASRLELEITESALVADLEATKRVLGDIHETGVKIALNNFGTGYSSLYHLRNFKLDTIKIDRSFVQAMANNPESAAIVRALIGLGSGLGLTVAAEGVQDELQQTMLANEGCQQAQGFLFSRPVTAGEAWELLNANPGTLRASSR
ncbi:EAL domain-containing protein [Mesorhizobium sp. ESP7-2]|uniref:putative bifunctional diguanylate cyclase/phosphodiesterase n=1 Tax=Mesorhizobium sp. ESP7-2 TaxID=2876622 RepID=UPI001CCB662C|nr:EAL domain-containing protein [Mesorhizobium sp. ESP7-2]MBZ9711119.1 EAL domain-containing protein [Mesorhizobium sp. ESP7-2]